ncbi:MAG: DUF523 domain-containing protein [Pseudomonadota bacterium]
MKKKVAISACLMGQAVRYDGLSKLHQPIMTYLASQLDLIPFCPEVAIGLSVPREKIQLCCDNKQVRVQQVADGRFDYTQQLSSYARQFIAQNTDLPAIILKSRSPSCGLFSTPVIQDGKEVRLGSGQFAYIIKTEYKSILLIEETELENIKQCNKFLSYLTDNR